MRLVSSLTYVSISTRLRILAKRVQRYYDGPPLENGGTALSTKAVSPATSRLLDNGYIKKGDKVLDYGAGNGRNAAWLRSKGVKVYAYDPHNGTSDVDGWKGVSDTLPNGKFDLGLTSFVLNVVPKKEEKRIIADVEKRCARSAHVTRNKDLVDSVKKALQDKNSVVSQFFWSVYAPKHKVRITDAVVLDLCKYGTKTTKGFQRLPMLEDSGFDLTFETDGYKVYTK